MQEMKNKEQQLCDSNLTNNAIYLHLVFTFLKVESVKFVLIYDFYNSKRLLSR